MSWEWQAFLLVTVVIDVISWLPSWFFPHVVWLTSVHLLTRIIISLIFLGDVALKCAAHGPLILSKPLCIFDLLLSLACLIFTLIELWLHVQRDGKGTSKDDPLILQVLRLVAIILRNVRRLMFCVRGPCLPFAKYVASSKKRRFVDMEHGFDLDLSYIVPDKVIAMGVPCRDWDFSLCFRNQISDVVRFFESRHPDKYLIVNACPELPYPDAEFARGSVVKFDVQDHSPPTISQFLRFLGVAHAHMDQSEDNVLAVHCKGGKGRTGSFIIAWLLHTRRRNRCEDAMDLFASKRSVSGKVGGGVETPSQVRYLHYFENLCSLDAANAAVSSGLVPQMPPACQVKLKELELRDAWVGSSPEELIAAVHLREPEGGSRVVFWSDIMVCSRESNSDLRFDLGGTAVTGDVRVSIFDLHKLVRKALRSDFVLPVLPVDKAQFANLRASIGSGPEPNKLFLSKIADRPTCLAGEEPGCLFTFMFHVFFLADGQLRLQMSDMDKACKRPKVYNPKGKVTLSYS